MPGIRMQHAPAGARLWVPVQLHHWARKRGAPATADKKSTSCHRKNGGSKVKESLQRICFLVLTIFILKKSIALNAQDLGARTVDSYRTTNSRAQLRSLHTCMRTMRILWNEPEGNTRKIVWIAGNLRVSLSDCVDNIRIQSPTLVLREIIQFKK